MACSNLVGVLKVFGSTSSSEEAQEELYEKVLLTILALASKADANVHPLEIETIQRIMLRETGQELTEADIRKAMADMFESANIRKYLRRVQSRLNVENKSTILKALVDVIKSDTQINVLEIVFFNRVIDALRMTPAEQFGLKA